MRLVFALVIGVLFVCIDILSPRRKLAVFSGVILGLLVGVAIAFALSFVTQLLFDQAVTSAKIVLKPGQREMLLRYINMLIGVTACYLSISFIMQTKDDFRFIIPYTEFSKQTKGARPILLDTSVLIDGRIVDIASTGVLESQLIVPRFVLSELHTIADSGDKLKRNRGRRGLDVLAKLQGSRRVEVVLYEAGRDHEESADVDSRLMALAKELGARVLTNDFNLNKVAQLRGVDVININDLANAVKPIVLPGEKMNVRVVKPGDQPGQGVGYLDDGTMVVVEQARQHVGEEIEFVVSNATQSSAGRMIFGRLGDGAMAAPRPRALPRSDAPAKTT
jgi:uncharacterized protein YacL